MARAMHPEMRVAAKRLSRNRFPLSVQALCSSSALIQLNVSAFEAIDA
jgi:hypothetical protein